MIRRLEFAALGVALGVAAFSSGLSFLFYLLYLVILVVGGSFVATRLGLADLEAGYAVGQLYGHVGEQLRVTYTLRNGARMFKPWLEVYNPTSLPEPIPGRAVALGPRSERSWIARVRLTRRGHFRIEPLQVRTGDPFGFFEASASVGQAMTLVVYPRIDSLPLWRLPAADLEGSHTAPERTFQTSPLATTVRPYAPGDNFNRIHWRSTARHGEILVKEFDLEQTADVWILLDLDRQVQSGEGEHATAEIAIRAAASIADQSLAENRAVGLTTFGHRVSILPADRGGRQRMKILQLLAAVDADGSAPLVEGLLSALTRLRRGTSAVVITSSLDTSWVRPLAGLRARGVACVVLSVDGESSRRLSGVRRPADDRAAARRGVAAPEPGEVAPGNALRHALAEYDLRTYPIVAGRPLNEQLAG